MGDDVKWKYIIMSQGGGISGAATSEFVCTVLS